MSTTHAFVEHYGSSFTYSLNSPDPSSLSHSSPSSPSSSSPPTTPSTPTRLTSSTASSPSSSSRSKLSVTPKAARRVSSQPAFPSNSLAPPAPSPRHLPPLPTYQASSHVLSTPDPSEAVTPTRQSVQIPSTGGPVNWSRPFPHSPPQLVRTPPARSPTSPARPRTMSANLALRAPPRRAAAASPVSSSSDDEVLPTTPHLLPPGAAAAEHPPPETSKSWAVVSECKGLGMVGIAEFEPEQTIGVLAEDASGVAISSCSSSTSEASLAGESVNTVSSIGSGPSTPTRLLFVSETLETLSNPATLDELRSLRAKAAELDKESKRLRRLRGREPAPPAHLLPRKPVPIVTAIDLQTAPKPRRPAVRHSLIATPSTEQSFAGLVSDPLNVPSGGPPSSFAFGLNRSAFALPSHNAAASRRPFYAQGKAAMSVIEFSPRKAPEPAAPVTPFSSRTRHISGVVPTLSSLRRDKGDKAARDTIQIIPAVPVFDAPPPQPKPQIHVQTQSHSQPQTQPSAQPTVSNSPPSPSTPFVERTMSIKTGTGGFLGKHKKLSRFLGKAQVA